MALDTKGVLTLVKTLVVDLIPDLIDAIQGLMDNPDAAQKYRDMDVKVMVSFGGEPGESIEVLKTIEESRWKEEE